MQVRKVTEYLGPATTAGFDLEAVRGGIQRAWQAGVEAGTSVGPDSSTALPLPYEEQQRSLAA